MQFENLNKIKMTSIIDGSDRFIFLLTCGIPDLSYWGNYLKPDGFLLSIGMHFWDKGGSKGGLAELVELVIDESEKNAAFADSWISYNDNFDLGKVLIHYSK